MARIMPTITFFMRGLGPLRPSLHLLRGLYSFSNRLRERLRESSVNSHGRRNSLVKFSNLADDYPHLKRALASKGIREIRFNLENKTFLPRERMVAEMISRSIRVIMRELDTHGRPTEESTALLYDYSDREQVLESEIVLTAKSSNEIKATITLQTVPNYIKTKNGAF